MNPTPARSCRSLSLDRRPRRRLPPARRLHGPRVSIASGTPRVERVVYRVIGVDPDADQRWSVYLRSVLAFSLVSIVVLYAILRLQALPALLAGPRGHAAAQALNTAVSFVTNTNWQSYSGEAALGYIVQMAGLAVQNFVSAAVGMAVAVALVRGFARTRTDRLGNFWVDLVRVTLRILLPLAVVVAVVLIAGGVVQNFAATPRVTTLAGGAQTIPGGPVASQEAIKELGTNGGGFYNANSAHPFENPNGLDQPARDLPAAGDPVQPAPHLRPDGRRPAAGLRDRRRRWRACWPPSRPLHRRGPRSATRGPALQLAGAAMEGKEVRFGVPKSAVFAVRDDADLDRRGRLVPRLSYTASAAG